MPIPVSQAGADQSFAYSASPVGVTLAGAATNTPILEWDWVMLSVPAGSSANVGTNQDFSNGRSSLQNPDFDMDVPGCYVLRLRARNASGWSLPEVDKEGGQTLCFMRTEDFDLEVPGYQAYRYDSYLNGSLLDLESNLADHSVRHQHGGDDEIATATPAANAIPKADGSNKLAIGWNPTAAPGATGVATASGEGAATTLARSDHTHQSNTSPADVTKAAAAIGTSGEPARADHKHDVTTAAPGATGVATASGDGSATTLARSDHTHQSNTSPADVTKAAAAIGTSGEPARADHKHDVTTAAPGATGVASGEGSATTLARSDHTHQSNTSPADLTKAAAVIGTSGEPARADHKHDVSTAAPAATGVSTASGEGSATSLARSDHSHQSNTAPADVTKETAAIGTSGEPARADHKHNISTATAGAATPGDSAAEGSATSLARSDHQHSLPAFGSSAATFCEGNDSRLSDARTPTAHDLAGSEHNADALADLNSKITDYNLGTPVTASASGPVSVTANDSGKVYTNEGASAEVEFTLPTAAAGLNYTFVVQDADGIQVTAASGDTIRIAASVTPAAGDISTTTIGNTVKLIAINDTEWIAVYYVGTWTVSS